MSLLDKLFGTTPSADTFVHDGLRAMRMSEFVFAEKCFRRALAEKEDLQVESYLAESLIRQQRAAEAAVPLRKLCTARPEDPDSLLMLAESLSQAGLYDELATVAERLGSLLPGDPRTKLAEARAAAGHGDPFSALAALTQAIAAEPGYTAARFERARLLLSMGQGAEALEDAGILTESDSENAEFAALKAEALRQSGRDQEAMEAYERALELNPFSEKDILVLAGLYDSCHQTEKALELLSEAIGNLPEFAEAYQLRGGIRLRLHDKEGAMDDLKKAVSLKPETLDTPDGEYTNVANHMQNYLKNLNPYGF